MGNPRLGISQTPATIRINHELPQASPFEDFKNHAILHLLSSYLYRCLEENPQTGKLELTKVLQTLEESVNTCSDLETAFKRLSPQEQKQLRNEIPAKTLHQLYQIHRSPDSQSFWKACLQLGEKELFQDSTFAATNLLIYIERFSDTPKGRVLYSDYAPSAEIRRQVSFDLAPMRGQAASAENAKFFVREIGKQLSDPLFFAALFIGAAAGSATRRWAARQTWANANTRWLSVTRTQELYGGAIEIGLGKHLFPSRLRASTKIALLGAGAEGFAGSLTLAWGGDLLNAKPHKGVFESLTSYLPASFIAAFLPFLVRRFIFLPKSLRKSVKSFSKFELKWYKEGALDTLRKSTTETVVLKQKPIWEAGFVRNTPQLLSQYGMTAPLFTAGQLMHNSPFFFPHEASEQRIMRHYLIK